MPAKRKQDRSGKIVETNDALGIKLKEIHKLVVVADMKDVANRYEIAVACRDVARQPPLWRPSREETGRPSGLVGVEGPSVRGVGGHLARPGGVLPTRHQERQVQKTLVVVALRRTVAGKRPRAA